ncbi:hypothetical protein GCM10008014_13360 [Paenibacillus silvae]|uniref:Uncharacterized protein n=1 Tax=Paenibacillus silvae TaxID=1325358 RepID=A0ABQ1Z6B0_9BACL|nr:hypothetical protein GCM10008014_13360 [Paenibacillus silvae]
MENTGEELLISKFLMKSRLDMAVESQNGNIYYSPWLQNCDILNAAEISGEEMRGM